tara:strand:+ start:1068 stop:1409 length:342 start_codon:yes stop_codon:yes gene_type:complete
MKKTTKKMLSVVGIAVGFYIVYIMLRKKTASTTTKTSLVTLPSKDENLEYVKQTFGLSSDKAKELIIYSEENIAPSKEWYEHTVKRASETGRDVGKQIFHEAFFQLYEKDKTK